MSVEASWLWPQIQIQSSRLITYLCELSFVFTSGFTICCRLRFQSAWSSRWNEKSSLSPCPIPSSNADFELSCSGDCQSKMKFVHTSTAINAIDIELVNGQMNSARRQRQSVWPHPRTNLICCQWQKMYHWGWCWRRYWFEGQTDAYWPIGRSCDRSFEISLEIWECSIGRRAP